LSCCHLRASTNIVISIFPAAAIASVVVATFGTTLDNRAVAAMDDIEMTPLMKMME
jgi:hypothetical protein